MKIVHTVSEVRMELESHRTVQIGFVPTMGYLHPGHLSLVKRAKKECDFVVLSIFVNPLQFDSYEDLRCYPRDVQRDIVMAQENGVDLLFCPTTEEMYPKKSLTTVKVAKVTDRLCGASRPGHFEGVATVVTQLLNIVQPHRAYFGLKDAQQVAVIIQITQDLHFPILIVSCPIIRETDGLAMSSRNVLLSSQERQEATILYQTLTEIKKQLLEGKMEYANEVNELAKRRICSQPSAKIDYVETLSYPELQPIERLSGQSILIAFAVWFGQIRLIDNLLLFVPE